MAGLAGSALAGRVLSASTPTPSPACLLGGGALNPHGFRVFRIANPPQSDGAPSVARYSSWPVTDTMTCQAGAVTSTWTGGPSKTKSPINAWYYVWANRAANPNQKVLGPNPIQSPLIIEPVSGLACRVNYTTIEKANAATQCLIRYWLGRSDYMKPWLKIAGTSPADFITYAQLAANPSAYFTTTFAVSNHHLVESFRVMTDRPWLPSAPASASNPKGLYQRQFMMPSLPAYQYAPGVMLDFEVGDGRTTGTGHASGDAQGTLNFLKRLSADIHATADETGRPQHAAQLGLYTDALNGPSMVHSGLDVTNLGEICREHVDLMSIMISGANLEGSVQKSYDNQIRLLKTKPSDTIPFAKLFLTYDIGTTTVADSHFVFRMLLQNKWFNPPQNPAAVAIWDNGAPLCVPVTNTLLVGVLQGPQALSLG
jgi:hypothetical protein